MDAMDAMDTDTASALEVYQRHKRHYFGRPNEGDPLVAGPSPHELGVPDPYPWLERLDEYPAEVFLTWRDIAEVRRGGSVRVLEPQDYDTATTLTADHDMISENYFYDFHGAPVSGTGCDLWIKPGEALTAHFKRMMEGGR